MVRYTSSVTAAACLALLALDQLVFLRPRLLPQLLPAA
jgi:hypothetical protein